MKRMLCILVLFLGYAIPAYGTTFNAVLVGIIEYGDEDIFCAENDVALIQQKLEAFDCWEEINITICTETEKDATITKQMILNDLGSMSTSDGNVNPFYFSGHGTTEGLRIYVDGENDDYISPYELDDAMDGNGSFEDFVCILDACNTVRTFCNGSMTQGVICGASSYSAFFGVKPNFTGIPDHSHYTYLN